jgi:hypothetical protein
MTLVARVMKFTSKVLEMKGKVLEARRLHSITFTMLSFASSWMLNGPEMRSARAICAAI